MPPAAATAIAAAGDVVALEHVDPATGAWRFAIASVAAATAATAHARAAFVHPWEPVPRRDLSAAERAEATKLQAEATAMLRNCVAERRSLEAVRGDLKQQLSDVASELATVEEQISDVLPILDEARAKVAGIKLTHLREVRAYKKPPAFIKAIMEPVQILLREPSKAVGDWAKAVAMMATVDFVPRVRDLDPALLPADVEKRFLKHMLAAFPPTQGDEDDAHAKDVAKAYHSSAAAGPLLEWVFAVRSFLLKVPAEAKEALKRVASLREAARQLQSDVDRKAADLRAANHKRAVLEMRLGEIKFGAAAALIDVEASEAAEPMTLLRAPDGPHASVLSSFWRLVVGADGGAVVKPVAVPRSTLLCRLRASMAAASAAAEASDAAKNPSEAEQEAIDELDRTTFELRPELLAGILSAVQGAGAAAVVTPHVVPVAPEAMISVDLPSPGAAGAMTAQQSGRKSGRSASGNRKGSTTSTAAARRSRSRESSSQDRRARPPSAAEKAADVPAATSSSGAHHLSPSAAPTPGSEGRPATGGPRKQAGSELTQVPSLAKTSDAAKESRTSSRASSRAPSASRRVSSRDASSRPVSVSPARSAVPTLPPLSPSTTPRLSGR